MIDYLIDVEQRLPEMLLSLDGWMTRFVTYEKPHVERLFRQEGENRIYLHKIHKCEADEAYWHVHPWPSAMRIVSGYYTMKIGFNEKSAGRFVLGPGSLYEMTDVDAQHSVQPMTKFTYSLMVTGPVWPARKGMSVQNPDLSHEKAEELLKKFQKLYPVRW